ncbi:hypothetical protein PENFLA_c006G01851 [Penicillium flavigenum]|uniref:Uncharacterized protein n=1 Tax=Penicillium flavigenum TaxID=254877 RepID=A0A1V6TM66_9EURO|nr:hypothetical protein PENFLA_c006G01851 [Penicillium flavigenum]
MEVQMPQRYNKLIPSLHPVLFSSSSVTAEDTLYAKVEALEPTGEGEYLIVRIKVIATYLAPRYGISSKIHNLHKLGYMETSMMAFKMDPADVQLRIEVDDDGLAHIRTNPAVPYVLPSVEDDFDEDPLIESSSTRVKRKRHTASTHAQEHQSAQDVGPSAWYLSAAYWNSLTFTRASPPDDSRLTRLGTEVSGLSPRAKRQLLNSMPPLDTEELPDPPRETNNLSSRVWESYRPSNLHFTIYEDPQDQETPNPSPMEQPLNPLEEDKENIFLTQSDLGSSGEEEESTMPNLAWNEASTGPRDAFGLPLHRQMSDFVPPQDTPLPEPPMRRGRQVLRTLWVDETQVHQEDNGLADRQMQDIEQNEAMYRRGRARIRSNRYQVREDTPFGPRTDFNGVRRVLFQRREDRPATVEQNEESRSVTLEQNEGTHSVTAEENEEEPQQGQQVQQENDQEQEQEH